MTERSDRERSALLDALSDDELLAAVRAGDTGAYSALYHRHLGAALAFARRLGGSYDPQDVAQEAFLKILKTIIGGGGPQDGFVAYLMRVVRNESIDRSRRAREIAVEDVQTVDPAGMLVSDGADQRIDQTLMQRAYRSLPAAWQQVLWLTEVEGLAPRAVAPQLQLSPNAVAQLSRRARDGLRTAWLQAHVDVSSAQEGCRQTAASLGAYERGQLSAARAARVGAHLQGCLRCSAALEELRRISMGLRAALLPVILGSPFLLGSLSDVLVGAGKGIVLAAVQGVSGAGTSGGAAAGSKSVGQLMWWKASATMPGWTVAAAGSVAAVAVAVATLVITAQLPSAPSTSSPGSTTAGAHDPGEDPAGEAASPGPVQPATASDVPKYTEVGMAPAGGSVEFESADDGDGSPAPVDGPTAAPQPVSREPSSPTAEPQAAPSPSPSREGDTTPVSPPPPVVLPHDPLQPSLPAPPGPEPTVEPTAPGPTEEPDGPAQPAPEEPAGSEPKEPEPTEPEPTEPEPTDEPTASVPTEDPVDPEPTEPVEPEPTEPGEPEPTEPTESVEPEPVEPPTTEEPTEPEPSEPEPEVSTPVVSFPAGGTHALPITLTGKGAPGAVVLIHDAEDRAVGSTLVGEDGTWSVSPTPGAPDLPTRYRVVQEAGGVTSPSSEWSEDYVFAAPELLGPSDGSEIPANTSQGGWSAAWIVLTIGLSENQGYAVLIDGQQWNFRAQGAGAMARHLALLEMGEHTIGLAYRDPDTGQLGAIRSATLTVR